MTLSEHDAYITGRDDMEKNDSAKYPVVKDNKLKQLKQCCKYSLEMSKLIITYLKCNIIHATKQDKKSTKMNKTQIPEEFELADEEPTTIKLDEEQKLTSKFIAFDCPLCQGKLQLRMKLKSTLKANSVSVIHIALKSARVIR